MSEILQPNLNTYSKLKPNTHKKLQSSHSRTSLIDVTDKLPIQPPCRILFKNEMEHASGSFKLRGIGNLVKTSIEKAQSKGIPLNQIHVFASSGGNAGLAAAYSAKFYNVSCTVAIPIIAKPIIQTKLKEFGARVILFGNSINEADQHLKNIINSASQDIFPIYCHPFDNPEIWHGHSTLVDEVSQQVENKDKIKGFVCSFGGGGLYNGIYQGMVQNDISGDILLLETAQAPTLTETIKANNIIQLKNVNSLATSLACSYTTKQSLQYYQDRDNGIQSHLELIDDMDALRACIAYNKCCKKTVEPACGTALSVCYDKIDLLFKNFSHLKKDDILVIVVCGGSCTTDEELKQFEQILKKSETKL
ncbi:CHA1 [Candida pseudojiufengensis]|uniref:CHA1 n=1 Tax=Candida pseudojiufengensis TaxID=497109 RepID=UPI00222562A6|nr:CHA1 [Candida pseudojiufengensis]KAI5960655.1 CHA1 [Candida pseudojiufengensis]